MLKIGWTLIGVSIFCMLMGKRTEDFKGSMFFLRIAQVFSISACIVFIVSFFIR